MKDHLFSVKEIIVVTFIGIVGVVIWGLHIGQDLGPDLVNYHFYNAYIAFHSQRVVSDIFPAGIQGYLNPYIYAYVYALYKLFPPIVVGAIIAALHGTCFISAYVVSKILLEDWQNKFLICLIAFISAVFGTISPFFLGMVGSSFSDSPTAPLILIPLALVLLMRFPNPEKRIKDGYYYFFLIFAGLMMGFSVGFKLVNCAFVFGLLVAWAYKFHFSKKDIWGAIVLFGAVGVGFLIVNGYWMWRLYVHFQNPLFPFYNHIFKSKMIGNIWTNIPAWAAAHNMREFFLYPFYWAKGIPSPTEWNFRDPRYALIYVLLVFVVISWFVPRSVRQKILNVVSQKTHLKPAPKPSAYIIGRYWFFSLWVLVSYLFWINQFGAMRYLIPITLVTGMIILLCIIRLVPFRKLAILLWIVLLVSSLFYIQGVYFGRVPWKNSWYPVPIPSQLLTSKNTLYLNEGLSFVIPFLPRDAQFIGVGHLTFEDGSTAKAKKIIAEHKGPMRTLDFLPRSQFYADQLSKFGVQRDPTDCVHFMGGVYPFESCRLIPLSGTGKVFTFPQKVTMIFDSQSSSPWVSYTKGFSSPEPAGSWTDGPIADIQFAGILPNKFYFTIRASAFGTNVNKPVAFIFGKKVYFARFSGDVQNITFPVDLQGVSVIHLSIRIPTPISPHDYGDRKSGDMRKLGLFLEQMTISSQAPN